MSEVIEKNLCMDGKVDYSFVVLTYSNKFSLGEIINKLPLNQKYNIQVIIINRHNIDIEDGTDSEYKNINIKIVDVDEACSDAEGYSHSKAFIRGEYICFTNTECTYDMDALKWVSKIVDSNDMPLVSLSYRCGGKRKGHHSGDKSVEIVTSERNTAIFLPAFFVMKNIAMEIEFSSVCNEETGMMAGLLLLKLVEKRITVKGCYCHYSKKVSMNSKNYYGCRNKKFYIDSLKYNYLPFIKQFVNNERPIPRWVQLNVYYQLYFKVYSNINVRDKSLLNEEEKKEFFEIAKSILQYIDDNIIIDNMSHEPFKPPFSIRYLFLFLKYNGNDKLINPKFYLEDNRLLFSACNCRYDLTKHQDLKIKAFSIKNGELIIDLRFFSNMLYEQNKNAIYAEINGIRHDVIPTGIYAHDKVFGISIKKSYTFQLPICMDMINDGNIEIKFYLELYGERISLPLHFDRAPSKLNSHCHNAYWRVNEDHIIQYEDNALYITNIDKITLQKIEFRYVKECIKWLKQSVKNRVKCRFYIKELKSIRKSYFKEINKNPTRRIWIYFDKLYKGGDNGEYQFRHDYSVDDGVERYYVINSNSIDAECLVAEFGDSILFYGTQKCKLYGLLAENIVATHPDVIEFLGFNKKETTIFKDLFNANVICIAHGITIQKNADYQNRLFDNTKFYTTSSKYEVEHILKPIYGYEDTQVALTGMARFDGLINRDKKKVLITPTWRRNIVGGASRNSTRKYNPLFKETNYFKIYNKLINDERLIEKAKNTGYEIVFLLHPSMSAQLEDYDSNEFVKIIAASGDMNYEEILTESSLMVTDYSGIHYDFGYMRKPVIYYQPKEVPMRFEEGGMKFATMGFGPVCTEYEDAVKLICEYMGNNCVMPEQYKKNADDFFAFDDHNNCKRIYEAITCWTQDNKQK